MGYYSIVLRIVSVDFHRLVKPIDINRLIFCRFYCLYYWFRWLIFIDWACQGLTKATVLVRTTPWFVINIMFGVSSSRKAGKHSKKHLASTPKQALKNNFFQIISSFDRFLSQRATRLAAVFIRTSFSISRGCLTLRNFSVIKPKNQWACLTR